jgi:hypothetical protein
LFLTCREVEAFAKRLDSVWKESHIGGNGSARRFPGMFFHISSLCYDSGTTVVTSENFIGGVGGGGGGI